MLVVNPFVSFSRAMLVDSSLDFLVRLCKLIVTALFTKVLAC